MKNQPSSTSNIPSEKMNNMFRSSLRFIFLCTHLFSLPFINQNEDVVGIKIDVSSYVVSEAVKSIRSEFEVYLTSQSISTFYFEFPTSLPFEVYSEPPQFSVSPDNWNYSFNVSILAVDDFYNDGNLSLYILPSILYSSDTDYMDLELDWISLTKLDDPFNEVDLASVGVSINHSFEMSVATSDYKKYTSQAGGEVELVMTLSSKPTGYVI